MSVYFTSDLHLGHAHTAKNRGFGDDIEAHDRAVIASLASLNKRTLLWVLGDIAWAPGGLSLLSSLQCRKIAVLGNHDRLSADHYLSYFEDVHGAVKYKGHWLTHIPMHPQEIYEGQLNVHGHIHKNADTKTLPLPYLCVNWDFWGRAVSLEEVREAAETLVGT